MDYADRLTPTADFNDSVKHVAACLPDICRVFNDALHLRDVPSEPRPHDDIQRDPIATLGIHEAKRHLSRSLSPVTFMGLINYVRRSFIDLVSDARFDRSYEDASRRFVDLFFDRLELGFMVESNRVNPESEMRRKAEEWEQTFDAVPDFIMILDAGHHITRYNRAMKNALGMGPPNRVSGHCFSCMHNSAEPISNCPFVKAVRERKTVTEEVYAEALDKHLLVTVSPFFNRDGSVRGCAHVARDISDIRKAEQTVRYQMNFLRAMLDAIPSPVFFKDEQLRYQGCNDSFHEFLGIPKDSIVGRSVYDLAPKELADAYQMKDAELLRNGGTQVYEHVVRRADGTLRDVVFHKAAFLKDDGTVEGLIGVILDITDRKATEKALQESEKRYRHLVEQANDGIFVAQDGMIRFVNPRGSEIAGYTAEELLAMPFSALVHPEDRARVMAYHEERLEGRDTRFCYSFRMHDKSGKLKWLRLGSSLISWLGRPAALCVVSDITEQKRSEERQQELVEEIKQFASIVSHDLRSPLVNLRGFSEELSADIDTVRPLLERAADVLTADEKTTVRSILELDIPECLQYITSAVTRMDRLIAATLELSRVGRRELDIERIDMTLLFRRTVDSFAHEIEGAGIRLEVHALPEVEADLLSMEQIISNLLANAIKYAAKDRPPMIGVTANRLPDETVFSVEDNGRGIDPAFINRIFLLFQRGGHTDVPGDGMGLAYVKTLVRRHGGHIWCESVPGKGSTFTFTISNHLIRQENAA
ncbi:MAG: PAS domain S-box protein [Pseudomonadota bacterium]